MKDSPITIKPTSATPTRETCVEVLISNDQIIKGKVCIAGKGARVSDLIKREDTFLTVFTEEKHHVINKEHIVYIKETQEEDTKKCMLAETRESRIHITTSMGKRVEGTIYVPTRYDRLSDFIKDPTVKFITVFVDENIHHIVNKQHIVDATEIL